MKIRVLFGSRAGDVVDYQRHIALRLLAEGRAVMPEVDVTVPAPVVEVVSTKPEAGYFRRKRRQ